MAGHLRVVMRVEIGSCRLGEGESADALRGGSVIGD